MKRLALLALLVVVVAGCGGSSSSARLGPDDVAVAGETAVPKEKFQALMARAKQSYEASNQAGKRPFPKPGSAEYEQLKGHAVTFLVVRAEFEQELENMGGEVTDEDVDKELEKLKKQYYGNDNKRYEQALAAQNLTEEQAKEELRADLVAQRLYNKVTEDVKVTDEEIKEYYDTHKSQYVQPQSREVRHILVEKKALADQLYAQLRSGGNFAALAKKYSKDPGSAQNGGKLTVTKGQTVPEFDKTTFELKKNELSKPVKTQYGYHIIQALSDIKPESKTPLAKVEPSIKRDLEKQQKDEAMTKWVADTKKEYCDSKIKYQVGYQPNPDPCTTASTTTG